MTALLLVALVLGILASGPAEAAPEGFDVHDLLAMQRISGMSVDERGERVAFALRTTDLEANRGRTDLWMVEVESGDLRRLTADPASDHSPAWSGDGRSIYFLSSRGGSSQVWRLPLDGGEAEAVTSLPLDVTSFRWSPDESLLGVSLDVFVDAATLAETVERREEEPLSSALAYDSLFVRHWDQWKDERRSHLFVAPRDRADDAEAYVDVMAGMDADCPTKPFGGVGDWVFTPDGNGIVFSARDVGASEAWSTDFDLYHVGVEGGDRLCLTEENEAWDLSPVFSPNGRTLAYLAMVEPGYESDRNRVVLRSYSGRDGGSFGEAEVLTGDWDRSPGSLGWTPDGKALLTHANDLGYRVLFRVDARRGAVTEIFRHGSVRAEAIAGGRLFVAANAFEHPVELFVGRPDGSKMERLTRINDEHLAQTQMGESEQFTFVGANGDTVYGWVVFPADFDPAGQYPVAFLVHGGPQGSFGSGFHYRWNPQTYAGRGYAAVMIDFHGSSGYGQEFQDSIQSNWGGWPLEDLQKGLAHALGAYPWMDGERVAALGASYGGTMINWIAGAWNDRFTCLVNHDGLFDTRFGYFATEELWFPERDFDGTPWTNPESYERWNPANLVDRWQTPMLVVHGELDYRVPPIHGLAAFNALQRRGVPSRLLYFPDENHWVLKPHNSIRWHDEVLGWLDRWNRPEASR